MGSKKLWVENIFGQKMISVIQTIWVQIEFGPNLTKQSRSKRNLVKKILGKKNLGSKKFGGQSLQKWKFSYKCDDKLKLMML